MKRSLASSWYHRQLTPIAGKLITVLLIPWSSTACVITVLFWNLLFSRKTTSFWQQDVQGSACYCFSGGRVLELHRCRDHLLSTYCMDLPHRPRVRVRLRFRVRVHLIPRAACWLTYDFHLVRGVDLPGLVGHMARVLAALLRRQVLQTQRPPLLPAFLSSHSALLVQQRPVVLQPHDVGPRVAAGRALQPHRAAHRAGDDSLSHFRRLSETWTHCKRWREREKPLRSGAAGAKFAEKRQKSGSFHWLTD